MWCFLEFLEGFFCLKKTKAILDLSRVLSRVLLGAIWLGTLLLSALPYSVSFGAWAALPEPVQNKAPTLSPPELTQEEARQIAFQHLQRLLPTPLCPLQETIPKTASGLTIKVLKPDLQDKNFKNTIYKDASGLACFYGRNGALRMMEWESVGETHQQSWVSNRRYLYGKTAQNLGLQEGQLLFVTMKVSESTSYVFESSGTLYATWKKGQCIRVTGDACPK